MKKYHSIQRSSLESLIIKFLALPFFFFIIIIVSISSKLTSLETIYQPPITYGIRVPKQRGENCFDFGCVVHPVEITDKIEKDISDWANSLSNQSRKMTTTLSFGSINYSGLSRKGQSHQFNQDRGIIVYPFYHTEGNDVAQIDEHNFICAIFDGHGRTGELIAQYLLEHLPTLLYEKLSQQQHSDEIELTDDLVKKTLNDTFVEMDQSLDPYLAEVSGSTASLVLRIRSKLYIANVGDSTSMLVSYNANNVKNNDAIIVHSNRKDKGNIPEEKERIEQMGGKVFIPNKFNARVVAFNKVLNEPVSLGMSRSIGDWSHGQVGVIAEPIIDVINLKDVSHSHPNAGLFVISGSDGVFDRRRPQFVANHLADGLLSAEPTDRNIVSETLEVIRLATPTNPVGYCDDMSLMAVRIEI